MKRNISKLLIMAITALVVLVATSSCEAIKDYEDDKPSCGLYVNFVYDYNVQRADMFKDHIGYVRLYIFDSSDKLVAKRTETNTASLAPLKEYGYTMHFNESELPPDKYRLVAVAFQKDYDECLKSKGAKYRCDDLKIGDSYSQLKVRLDRSDTPDADGLYSVNNESVSLDTLWVGRGRNTENPYEEQMSEVKAGSMTHSTVYMVRDMKMLNVTIRQIDKPTEISSDDYELRVEYPNGLLDCNNDVVEDGKLLYTPFAQWTTETTSIASDGTEQVEQKTAHYDLSFNRLVYGAENYAFLRIIRKSDGKEIGRFNLTSILADARSAFETYNYSPQEFLDREYDYRLDFYLKGDSWKYMDVRISILAWTKRIQNEVLH